MTNKLKLKTISSTKRPGERRPPVDFVAPYSLEDCYNLLRETREMTPGSSGFSPELARLNTDTVEFHLRRMRYDSRYRRWSSAIAIKGYLQRLDATSTAVIGTIKISLRTQLVLGLMLVGWLTVLYMAYWVSTKIAILTVGLGLALLAWGAMLYLDRRALIRRIERQLAKPKGKRGM